MSRVEKIFKRPDDLVSFLGLVPDTCSNIESYLIYTGSHETIFHPRLRFLNTKAELDWRYCEEKPEPDDFFQGKIFETIAVENYGSINEKMAKIIKEGILIPAISKGYEIVWLRIVFGWITHSGYSCSVDHKEEIYIDENETKVIIDPDYSGSEEHIKEIIEFLGKPVVKENHKIE